MVVIEETVPPWRLPQKADTSSGLKTALTISAMTAAVWGVISEGLMITVFPAAMADARGPKVRFTGKFHGEIIRQTPFGSCMYVGTRANKHKRGLDP